MIPPNLNYVEIDSQLAHSYRRCACQIRYSHSYKTAPPASKPQGVIGPLVEWPDWIARPTCGRAMGGRRF